MNIKQVSEITGLTKKAIKYYESQGLIDVNKNPHNNIVNTRMIKYLN